jgi:hypothetical protein
MASVLKKLTSSVESEDSITRLTACLSGPFLNPERIVQASGVVIKPAGGTNLYLPA